MECNSQQKVALNTDRDSITPSYLHTLRVVVLKAMVVRLHKEGASAPESTEIAVAEKRSSPTTVNRLKRASANATGINNNV